MQETNNEGRHDKQRKSRPTIGLLNWGVGDTIGHDMWAGVADVAQERGANAICFVGGVLGAPGAAGTQANVLYELVGSENVDGLVMWSALLQQLSPVEARAIYERYRSIPMVSVGSLIEGVPSVLVDNYQGMRDEIVHLVKAHAYRRIAFIRGPEHDQEASDRYRAYIDVLAECGLALDPHLVVSGDNQVTSGVAAMQLLLDERCLRAGIDFEAVVGSNDNMAFGALETLQQRGLWVPSDVAVAGFDDVAQAQATVPVTTVRYPFYEQGRRAAEMLLGLLAGEQVPRQVTLSLELAVRRSCGCLSPTVAQAATGQVEKTGQSPQAVMRVERESVLAGMAQAVGDSGWVEQVFDGFAADTGGPSTDGFLSALDEALRQTAAAGGDAAAWQGALSVLRGHVLPALDGAAASRAEDLLQQARVMVGEAIRQTLMHREWRSEQRTAVVRAIGQDLIAASDVAELADVLAQGLPDLDIPGSCLSLYEKPGSADRWSRLVLAYDKEGRVELENGGQRFPSRQLVPGGLSCRDKRWTMLIEALYFRDEQLGFVLFQMDTLSSVQEMGAYEVLRGQVSSALHSALLTRQRDRLLADLERRSTQLQAAVDVSRAIGRILDPEELVQQAVALIQERFGYYYVGLFLVDWTGERIGEPGRFAVLHAGTGEPGRQMVERGHRVEMGGDSTIGQCMALGRARIALDVGEEAQRFDNPLLSDTRSEMALPLMSRGQAIGAVTLQSELRAAFSEQDVTALQTMADQLAAAIDTANLFERARARAEREQFVRTVTERIRRGSDKETIVRIALQELSRMLGASRAVVRLGTREQLLDVQQHNLRQEWEDYVAAEEFSWGYSRAGEEEGPTTDAWLSAMATAVQRVDVVAGSDGEGNSMLSLPIHVHGEVIGVMGFSRSDTGGWTEEKIAEAKAVVDQVALALENQRLLDEAQQATLLMGERVKALDCLNEIGRKTEASPPVPEFLQWGAERVPSAMRHSDVCLAAIEFEGQIYGASEAVELSRQIVQGLRIGGELVGRVHIAYTEEYDFLDEESALLGDIARRVSGYIESRRLAEQTQAALAQVEATHRRYLRETWDAFLEGRGAESPGYAVGPGGVTPAEDLWLPEMERALTSGETVTLLEEASDGVGQSRTALAVPLKIRGGQTIGVVDLYREGTIEDWTDEERALIEALAEQIADSIEGERLFEQTQTSLAETERLYEASRRISVARDREEIWQVVLDTVAGTVADKAALFVFDKPAVGDSPAFQDLSAFWDRAGAEPSAPLGTRYEAGEYPLLRALSPDEPLVIADILVDERMDGAGREMLLQMGVRSMAAIPISVGNEWLGYVLVMARTPHAFTLEELRVYRAVNDQAAIALRSQRLLRQAEGRARREALIRQITSKMRGTPDLDTILNTAVQELGQALGVSRAFVRLSIPEQADGGSEDRA